MWVLISLAFSFPPMIKGILYVLVAAEGFISREKKQKLDFFFFETKLDVLFKCLLLHHLIKYNK